MHTLLAGIIAGALYSGRYNWYCARGDLDQIINKWISCGYNEIPSFQPYWDKTIELLEKKEALLSEVANDLYEKKTLTNEYFEDFKRRVSTKNFLYLMPEH
jgi:hypothetical protein